MEPHNPMNNQTPPNNIRLFAEALLSGMPLDALIADSRLEPEDDLPIDPTGADLESICGSRILPTTAICNYLAIEDELTHATIDSMEIAMEKAYGIQAPFFITSMRGHFEGKPQVEYFYLMKV
jgi:hypothetical protein